MNREEILHKTSRTGTTAFFFAPNIQKDVIPELTDLSYITLSNFGQPNGYGYFEGGAPSKIVNSKNYYSNFAVSALTSSYLTGYSYSQVFNSRLNTEQKNLIQSRFEKSLADPAVISGLTITPYVIFEDKLIDDMHVSIKLTRNYETLDTLKIYNKTTNSIPTQEATTGVLFGRLEAIQIIKDETGHAHRIPLRNVPIGIFTSSEEFPSPTSLDDNGDRFYMNLKESSPQNNYFDSLAYENDQSYLRSASQFTSTPEKFKHMTITNDEGEFIIFDAPLGSNILVFEVDLFKQGLTWDEIVLNNFPFPTNDNVNIGQYPCYYYNQIPVDVVPCWGLEQSGYTEVNASVNLDLRKWTTYIFPPAAYGAEKLEVTTAKNAINTFKVQVRDMTSKNFSSSTIAVTQVPNDLDRKAFSKYSWANEMTDQRNQLEFYKFGCHVFKLPANLYDPNGYRTNDDGVPQTGNTSFKGVWLTAYQMRAYINKRLVYCDTGGYNNPNGNFYSHYGLNYNTGNGSAADGANLGQGIYSKPWTINFPNKYKIPRKPTQGRYAFGEQRTLKDPYVIEEPAYSDGDLIGNPVSSDPTDPNASAGGYAMQYPVTFGAWRPNHISYVATRSYMYKYERDVAWNETYSNGYEPVWSQTAKGPYDTTTLSFMAGISRVVNGEQFQRLECGYGYFMKHREWPRIFRIDFSSDLYFMPDIMHRSQLNPPLTNSGLAGDINNPGPAETVPATYNGYSTIRYWSNNVYNLENQNLAFAFNNPNGDSTRRNPIDIYRIVDSGIKNINQPVNFIIPTSIRIDFGHCEYIVFALQVTNSGSIDVTLNNSLRDIIWIEGGGITPRWVGLNENFTLPPGAYFVVDENERGLENAVFHPNNTLDYTTMKFPGNNNFDVDSNKYTECRYDVRLVINNVSNSPHFSDNVSTEVTSFNYTPGLNTPIWKFNTEPFDGGTITTGLNLNGAGEDNDDITWNVFLVQI